MSLPRPSAVVTLAGRKLTAAEAGLVSLRITLACGSHDVAEMAFWPRTKFSSAAMGDLVSIQLGMVDQESDVWSGEVTSVEQTSSALHITGHAPTIALSRTRKSQTYAGQQVAQIVRDLASSVTVDEADASAELSYYAVDHRRSVWGHLLDLAALTGSEISCSASGGLRFVPINALPSTTTFRFGAELLTWRLGPVSESAPAQFAAHGSASESGSQKWHWINPDPTTGAGEAQVIGGFHSRSLADDLTSALKKRAGRATVGGVVSLMGQKSLRPGDVFKLKDLPQADPGSLRALSVTHSLDGISGFRTTASVEGAGGGSLL